MSQPIPKPINEWVVIEPRDAFEHGDPSGEGGIILPQAYDDDAHGSHGDFIRERNSLCYGVVRAVGPGRQRWRGADFIGREIPDVEVGDRVMYCRASATLVEGSSPMLVIVREKGVMLKVESPAKAVLGGLISV